MFILGDVFAVVAVLVGLFLTGYALVFALGLLFQNAADEMSAQITDRPFATGLKGALTGVFSTIFFLVIAQIPLPLTKLMGSLGVMVILMMSMLGWSAIARIMSRRLTDMDPGMGAQVAWSRAVMILMGAALFPFIGWMVVAPALAFVGFGASLSLLKSRKPEIVTLQ